MLTVGVYGKHENFLKKSCERKKESSSVNYAVVQLYRETIINHALELLDAYGLADMTMRRVASSLGVAAGALYWHIANKQELITAVAAKILIPVFELVDGDDHRESDSTPSAMARAADTGPHASQVSQPQLPSPQEFCAKLQSTLLSHRDGAELVHAASSQPHSLLWSQLREYLALTINQELRAEGRVLSDGATIEVAADISATTTSALHLIFGASIMEQSAQQLLEATQPGQPRNAAKTTEPQPRPVVDDVERGITVLLAGLKTRLDNQEGSLS